MQWLSSTHEEDVDAEEMKEWPCRKVWVSDRATKHRSAHSWKLLPKTPCMRILFPCFCGLGCLRSLPSTDLMSKQCFWVHEIKKCKLANKPNGYLNIFKLSHSSVCSTLAPQGWADITYERPNNILCVVDQKVSGQRDTQMKGGTRNLNMQKQITAWICFIGFSYWPLNPRVLKKSRSGS